MRLPFVLVATRMARVSVLVSGLFAPEFWIKEQALETLFPQRR
jgi:hypothetical protein